jgi:hypothetical protein
MSMGSDYFEPIVWNLQAHLEDALWLLALEYVQHQETWFSDGDRHWYFAIQTLALIQSYYGLDYRGQPLPPGGRRVSKDVADIRIEYDLVCP